MKPPNGIESRRFRFKRWIKSFPSRVNYRTFCFFLCVENLVLLVVEVRDRRWVVIFLYTLVIVVNARLNLSEKLSAPLKLFLNILVVPCLLYTCWLYDIIFYDFAYSRTFPDANDLRWKMGLLVIIYGVFLYPIRILGLPASAVPGTNKGKNDSTATHIRMAKPDD